MIINNLKIAANRILDLVYPPKCLSCRSYILQNNNLCFECWQNIEFIKKPICMICGNPLNFYTSLEDITCANCISRKPNYNMARSIINYNAIARELITSFKYYDQTNLLSFIANLMTKYGKDAIQDVDLIIPIPIHYLRLLKRKYNQAALLAKFIGKYNNLPVEYNLLLKCKNTKSQMGLTKKQRMNNLKDSFIINKNKQNVIKNKNILLIDDVRTTETTIKKCTNILLEYGAAKVNILTFAYSIKV